MVRPLVLATLLLAHVPAPDPRAVTIIDAAITRMGGAPALAGLTRVRLELMTQWQRTTFDSRPYGDLPSYERHTEQRNYSIPAWRNLRRFPVGSSWREITDVVRDSVAIRQSNGAWAPLNVAYVDERHEVFTFAAERLLLEARAAVDLRSLSDTGIGGVPHARVTATVGGLPATLCFRRTDGLLALARYRAAQPNDFGLAPWGRMEVEIWYSRWTTGPDGTTLPRQLDVRRVGRPYKRITVLAFAVDTAAADSFVVSDSLRAAFLATANRPMQDVPLDSARMIQPGLVRFGSFGYPAGAIKVGASWLLLEGGQTPLNAERAVAWLRQNDGGAPVGGAMLTLPAESNGGAVWLQRQQVPLHLGAGATPFIETILRNHGASLPRNSAVTRGDWLRLGGDSVWVEPVDLPDAPGSLMVYLPALRWAYAAIAITPLHQRYVVERLRARGWAVERVGSLRDLWAVPPS